MCSIPSPSNANAFDNLGFNDQQCRAIPDSEPLTWKHNSFVEHSQQTSLPENSADSNQNSQDGHAVLVEPSRRPSEAPTIVSVPLLNFEHFLSDVSLEDDLNTTDSVVSEQDDLKLHHTEDVSSVARRLSRTSLAHCEQVPTLEDSPTSSYKWILRRWMESLPLTLITALCIILDVALVTADVIANTILDEKWEFKSNDTAALLPDRTGYVISDFLLSTYLLVELICCIVASEGVLPFVKYWRNNVDSVITISTFIFSLCDFIMEDTPLSNKLKILQMVRFIRLFRLFRLLTIRKRLEKSARVMVSRNKRRYQHDGFDLDLTYVTDRIIAMSFPSKGKMSLYRNPMTEVVRFLETKHPNCYKVYNLCSEKSYDSSYFKGSVERYPIDDHNVPTLQQMLEFTKSVRSWLEADPKNIIAVHCKGGKGRSGTMTCVLLIETGLFSNAEECLSYFGSRRTDTRTGHTFQGVETPSQSRYVGYYEQIKRQGGLIPPERNLCLKSLRIEEIDRIGKGDGSDFSFSIYVNRRTTPVLQAGFRRSPLYQVEHVKEYRCVEWTFNDRVSLQGDVRVVINNSSRNVPKVCMGVTLYFWFHTAFIATDSLVLTRDQLDNPHKTSNRRHFKRDFAVKLNFVNQLDER